MDVLVRCGRRRLVCRWLVAGAIALAVSGCATSRVSSGNPYDPWEPMNRTFYAFNDSLDRTVLAPAASLYLRVPSALRNRVTNFFDNAAYPGTVINQLLQGKINLALQDSVRFVFNTTLGIGGLFDISSGFGLKRHSEDFGQTLAVWGMKEGFYIHYPLVGPSSVRDTPAIVTGTLTDVVSWLAAWPLALLEAVNTRANFSSAAKLRDTSALDPYDFTRDAYRQHRRYLIHDGNPPMDDFDEFDDEEDDEEA